MGTCTPTPSCPEAPPCTPVLLTVCRRRSPPLLPPPSRSRSSLPPRGSTWHLLRPLPRVSVALCHGLDNFWLLQLHNCQQHSLPGYPCHRHARQLRDPGYRRWHPHPAE